MAPGGSLSPVILWTLVTREPRPTLQRMHTRTRTHTRRNMLSGSARTPSSDTGSLERLEGPCCEVLPLECLPRLGQGPLTADPSSAPRRSTELWLTYEKGLSANVLCSSCPAGKRGLLHVSTTPPRHAQAHTHFHSQFSEMSQALCPRENCLLGRRIRSQSQW